MSGVARIRWAICKSAGWTWCDEHQRARYKGSEPCDRLHDDRPMNSGLPALTLDESGQIEEPDDF